MGRSYRHKVSKETRKRIGEKHKGKKIPESLKEYYKKIYKGKRFSKATEFKKGEEHMFFNNWISREPYSKEWTSKLKKQIAKRDFYICKLCGKFAIKNGCPHHINYNKKDCSPENLIWLHHSCNIKVNHNRDYWFAYFCYIKGIEPEDLVK